MCEACAECPGVSASLPTAPLLKQAEAGEVIMGGAVPAGAGRLLPESWPQFLSPSGQSAEAEEEEPGEQDGGEDSGEMPGREPSPELLLAPAPARTLLSLAPSPSPTARRPSTEGWGC